MRANLNDATGGLAWPRLDTPPSRGFLCLVPGVSLLSASQQSNATEGMCAPAGLAVCRGGYSKGGLMSQLREFITSDIGQLAIGGAAPILAVMFLLLLAKYRRIHF
ncbi:hypothetical protein D3C80_1543530 [compost metagenome]